MLNSLEMVRFLKNNINKSGIYALKCLNTGLLYIGQSCNIGSRVGEHLGDLRKNKHSNVRLQKDWNKYGKDGFVAEILEYCDVEKLCVQEDYWFNQIQNKYNIAVYSSLKIPSLDCINRFWAKVNKTQDCWIWTGSKDKYGYGNFTPTKKIRAHRFAYFISNNFEDPKYGVVCHTCDNPSCVRPDHLKLGTFKDNAVDMAQKRRCRHCKFSQQQADDIRKLSLEYPNILRKELVLIAKDKLGIDLSISNITSILLNQRWCDPNWDISLVKRTIRKRLNWNIAEYIQNLYSKKYKPSFIRKRVYSIFSKDVNTKTIYDVARKVIWNKNSILNQLI